MKDNHNKKAFDPSEIEEYVIDSRNGNLWDGFKFPMGAFIVWSEDGRVAWGKCDPITHEILEWSEKEMEKYGEEVDKSGG